jgi:hypothetical protein
LKYSHFNGFSFILQHAISCRFEYLEMSYSVAFSESLQKATDCIIFHSFTIICANHFQEQKHTFAYLLECNGNNEKKKS